jgi:signal transduction histidine kinase
VIQVVRDGQLVALIVHDPEVGDPGLLEQQIGPAMRLAIENERLGAGILARVQDLQRSRARIVAVGDAERRRLERDLHDGAQQRLLALAYDLRLARAAAEREAETAAAMSLDQAIADARACHAELRDLAHGIYPAILAEAGLEVALETLADRATVALSVSAPPGRACGEGVESAVYAVVDEAVADAAGRGATTAHVTIERADQLLEITVDDDGEVRRAPPVHLADRVGAAGGRLSLPAPGSLSNRLVAEVPCA